VDLGDGGLLLALRRRRPHDAAHLGHRRPALRALAHERAAPHRGALGRGPLHREGGGRRLRPRCDRRLPDRRPPRPLQLPPARDPALHRRLADGADPRHRSDGRRLARRARAAAVVPRLGDRRLPDVLPRDHQRPARPRVGRPAGARADGVLRRRTLGGALEAPRPRLAPVPLRRVQDLRDGVRRRRHHRRAAGLDPGRARRRHPQLQPVLRVLAGEPLGDEPDRRVAREHLV
jgi:hypothetical protein